MMQLSLLNEILIKSPNIGGEIKRTIAYASLDPEVAATRARKVLEMLVCKMDVTHGDNLCERIQSLDDTVPEHIVTYMHFVRKIGNSAVHGSGDVSENIAKDICSALINLACWVLNIDPNKTQEKTARYFIADPIHRTWPKIAVLTNDGVLYSEYLTFMKLTPFRKHGLDFESFKASDFSFGEKEHGSAYQTIREVTYAEAKAFKLTAQDNWLDRYLMNVGVRGI